MFRAIIKNFTVAKAVTAFTLHNITTSNVTPEKLGVSEKGALSPSKFKRMGFLHARNQDEEFKNLNLTKRIAGMNFVVQKYEICLKNPGLSDIALQSRRNIVRDNIDISSEEFFNLNMDDIREGADDAKKQDKPEDQDQGKVNILYFNYSEFTVRLGRR